MTHFRLCLLFLCFSVPFGALTLRQSREGASPRSPARGSGDAQHGKYLVEEVAKCAECHTPRDSRAGPQGSAPDRPSFGSVRWA